MPLVNGNMYVKGVLNANTLLFKEITSTSDMTRGVNIDLVTGTLYYMVDNQNYFTFGSGTSSSSDTSSSSGTTVILSSAETNLILESQYDILNLVNTTFFSLNDHTASYLVNLNFDFSSDLIKAVWQLDKVLSSVYKNGTVRKCEYQTTPISYIQQYKNIDILPSFASIKMDNSAANSVDQSSLTNLYFQNLVEQSNYDISAALDLLLINNSDDHTLQADHSNLFYNQFFSLSWFNYKIDLLNKREFMSEFHNKIFNGESILYFFQNYMSLYRNLSVNRLKLYFFDYRYLIYANLFHLIDYIKDVYNSTSNYSNILAQNIIAYKIAHPDLTEQTKDYTSFEQQVDANELIDLIFDSDTNFGSKLDWNSLDVTISAMEQNLKSLNDSNFNNLDIKNIQSYIYSGNDIINPVIDKMWISQGEFSIPVFEVDFPLDSYFFFMM